MIHKTVSHYRISEKLHGYSTGVAYNAEDSHFGCTVPQVLHELARGAA